MKVADVMLTLAIALLVYTVVRQWRQQKPATAIRVDLTPSAALWS
jgi:hypothetical protein